MSNSPESGIMEYYEVMKYVLSEIAVYFALFLGEERKKHEKTGKSMK